MEPTTTPTNSIQKYQSLFIPAAIVIAGLLVAGTIFYTNTLAASHGSTPTTVQSTPIRDVQGDDHIRGSANAKAIIYEFSDPECPFCKAFHQTLLQVVGNYSGNDVAWVYRHFPIPQLHPKAPKEAEALECANAQGGSDAFWKYTDAIYEETNSNNSLDDGVYNTPATVPVDANGKPYYTQATPRSGTDAGKLSDIAVSIGLDKKQFEDCLAKGTYANRVQTDVNEAMAAGANGTPTSIIKTTAKFSAATLAVITQLQSQYGVTELTDKSVMIPGAIPYSALKQLLDSILK